MLSTVLYMQYREENQLHVCYGVGPAQKVCVVMVGVPGQEILRRIFAQQLLHSGRRTVR
jgi:hypothetical protein